MAEGASTTGGTTKAEDPVTKIKSITEGSITMTYPAEDESSVFYNPVQVQNRDLSILMLTLYSERLAIRKAVAQHKAHLRRQNHGKVDQERISGDEIARQLKEYEATLDPRQQVLLQNQQQDGMTIFDALAASGLRSMRYWNEIPGVKHVTINDLDPAAVQRAHSNIVTNSLSNVIVKAYDIFHKRSHHHDDPAATATTTWQRRYGIQIQQGDAKVELYKAQRPQALTVIPPNNAHAQLQAQLHPQWDVIDLDPYGSAAPFVDAAVQAIQSGGMLCITCTDMAALGGSHPETCYGRYASMPIPQARYLHEMALRILLCTIATAASKYGRTIRPILSVGMDFYIRVFVEVYDDKAGVNQLSLQIGSVFQSTQCPSFHIVPHGRLGGKKGTVYQPNRAPPVPVCEETGADFKMGGPIWLGPLHDPTVVQAALDRLTATTEETNATTTISRLNDNNADAADSTTATTSESAATETPPQYPEMKWIATRERLEGLLLSVKEELPDVPLYYGIPDFCRTLKCSAPPIHQVKAALINGGYQVSGFHKDPDAVKTNAPNRFVWDVLRSWCQKNPPVKEPVPDSPAGKILAEKPQHEIDFTIPPALREQIDANSKKHNAKGGKKRVSRFPMNPEAHWGPKKAASGTKKQKTDES